MDKKDLMKDSAVYDFAMQWSMDCMVNMEREPGRYILKINRIYCKDFGTQVSTWIYDEKMVMEKAGEAVCHVNDKYDFNLGIAVAWAKLHNIPLPKALQPKRYIDLREITPGEIFLNNIIDVVDRCIVIANNVDDKNRIVTFRNLDGDYYDIIVIPKNKKKRVELA